MRVTTVSPASSAIQAPSRAWPSGSTAGVQAEAGTCSTASWTASVIVIPTDNHHPRAVSQFKNSWVPLAESSFSSATARVFRPGRVGVGAHDAGEVDGQAAADLGLVEFEHAQAVGHPDRSA